MEKRELTCIGCPMGCQITVELEGTEILSVKGNTCAIGDKYARNEVIHPERTVTSTVVVDGGDKPRLSGTYKTVKEPIHGMEQHIDLRLHGLSAVFLKKVDEKKK